MNTIQTKISDTVKLRPGRMEDAAELGRICYEAFKTISEAHGFAPDIPSVEHGIGLISMGLGNPAIYNVVAENSNGKLLGSNFLWEMDAVAGIGPITVDPASQDASVGRRMMEYVLDHIDRKGTLSVRLVQSAFHNRSMALYTKLGFDAVEPLSLINGPKLGISIDGYSVRPMSAADVDAADKVTRNVHGHSRRNEIAHAASEGSAMIVEHDGRITGYSTVLGFFGHSAGETNEDLKALIGAAESIAGAGFLLPTRNSELMRWCLNNGLQIRQPLTLMSRGLYQEPNGAFLPSILF